MVHIAPLPPWRRRAQRIVGILLAVLGIVVLVIAVVALRQPNGHQAALHTSAVAESSTVSTPASPTVSATSTHPAGTVTTTPAATSKAPTSTAALGLKSVPLIVLNNTDTSKLALTAADRFRAGGWTVTSTANLDNNILSTCAYYDPAVANAQAAAAALQSQFPTIKRIEPKFAGLPTGPIVVVLTTDYS